MIGSEDGGRGREKMGRERDAISLSFDAFIARLYMTFEGYSPWTTDVHLYSMDDFHQVHSSFSYSTH